MVVATRVRSKQGEPRRRGFEVLDSSANFLFAKPNSVDAGWLFEELKKEKNLLFVILMESGLRGYLRNLRSEPINRWIVCCRQSTVLWHKKNERLARQSDQGKKS